MGDRWRNQFGGLNAEDAKRLKDLGRDNATLKGLLADIGLDKVALRPRKRLVGVPRAQSNARRHKSVRSAREIFCD
jgi:hypothetical protein